MNARAPLPPTALQTYLGRYAAVVASLRLTVYLLAILATGFALAVVVLSYALTKKQLTYITVSGVEQAGLVTENNARDFALDILHWMHNWSPANIDDRKAYLAPRICPDLVAATLQTFDAERPDILRHQIVQSIAVKSVTTLPPPLPDTWAFRVTLTRVSQVMGLSRTAYDETYELAIAHAPDNDGTLRLCVLLHTRTASKLEPR